jgi:hypothetical protein
VNDRPSTYSVSVSDANIKFSIERSPTNDVGAAQGVTA